MRTFLFRTFLVRTFLVRFFLVRAFLVVSKIEDKTVRLLCDPERSI